MSCHQELIALPPRVVLIVEDNADGRESLQALLALHGFRVEAASDGAEGVMMGLALRPFAAILDVGLPVLDGFDVARELRRAFGGEVLLIAHTAYASPDFRARADEAGFDHFLAKPCEIGELVRLLRGRLAQQPAANDSSTPSTSCGCAGLTR
jgi:DNA-binding response OmpR family regulator